MACPRWAYLRAEHHLDPLAEYDVEFPAGILRPAGAARVREPCAAGSAGDDGRGGHYECDSGDAGRIRVWVHVYDVGDVDVDLDCEWDAGDGDAYCAGGDWGGEGGVVGCFVGGWSCCSLSVTWFLNVFVLGGDEGEGGKGKEGG